MTDIASYLGFAIPVHLCTIAVLRWLGEFRTLTINYRLFLAAVTGDFSDPTASLGRLSIELREDGWRIAGYLLATILVAITLGRIAQYFVLRTAVKRILPLQNQWFNTFFLPDWEPVAGCRAYVMTKNEALGGPVLYDGFVTDFRSDGEGKLTEIRLRRPARCSLASGIDPSLPSHWTALKQELLIVYGSEIANLAVSYVRFWRPYAILARANVKLKAGEKRQVSIRPHWALRFFLGHANGIMLLTRPNTDNVRAHGGDRDYVEIEGRHEQGEIEVQVVATKRIRTDTLSENTGSPLFWLEQKIVNAWVHSVERRAGRWVQPKPKSLSPSPSPKSDAPPTRGR